MKTLSFHTRILLSLLLTLAPLALATKVSAQGQPPAAAASAVSTVRPRVTQAVDEAHLVPLKGNVHPLAKAKFDQGAVDDSAPVTRALILLQRSADQESSLRQLLDDQQNKSSANYHAWLTPQQFAAQFGPADSDVQAVTQWLSSHGFQNIKVGAGKTTIEFSGNVGQMRSAFHTDIHKFNIRGEVRNANISDPQIPAALAPVIGGVVGLTNFRPRAHLHKLGTFRKTTATGQLKPLNPRFTYAGDCFTSTNCFGVGPGDFAKIYNVPSTVNSQPAGQGQTIVVVNDSNINPQDLVDYRNLFGLPALTLAQATANIIVNGPDPGLTGDETEADLDTQIASAVAPNATVLLVVTEQPDSGVGAAGVDLSVLYTINNNLAPVISKSFGACEAFEGTSGNEFESALWEQASAQGISGMVSAGDTGSAACDPTSDSSLDFSVFGQAVSGDASTPFNVAVGGTDFNSSLANYAATYWSTTNSGTQTSALSYIPEIPWNDSCASSGSLSGCTAAIINEDSSGLEGTGPDLTGGAGGQSNCINVTEDAEGDITCNTVNGQLGYPKPSWQTGLGVPADGVRDLPDVSLFASNGQNNSFYIICEEDANSGTGSNTSSCDLNSPFNDFQGVGGTSASSPAFAAIMSLVNQQTGQRLGNPNYVLYALAAKPGATCTSQASPPPNASTCIFYDITTGNNSVACEGDTFGCSNTSGAADEFGILVNEDNPPFTNNTPSFNATANYDLATGLGSVNVTNLVAKWTTATPTLSTTSTTLLLNGGAAVNDTHGAPVTVAGTVTSGAGTPTGGFVELTQGSTSPGLVIDTFPLTNGSYSGTTTLLPGTGGGAYMVVARFGGEGTFAASTSSPSLVSGVSAETSKVVPYFVTFDANGNPIVNTSSTQSVTYGSSYILLVAVTSLNNSATTCTPPPFAQAPLLTPPVQACPTGTVTLLDGGKALNDFLVPNTTNTTNTSKLNNSGFAEDQPIQLIGTTAGNPHTITATYSGDNSFKSSASATPLTVTVNPAGTTTTVSSNVISITPGQSVTLTATVVGVSSNGAGPTGMVGFSFGSTVLSAGVTCGAQTNFNPNTGAPPSCTASFTTSALSMSPPPSTTPTQFPRWRTGPLWTAALALLIAFLLALRRIPPQRRCVFVYAGALAFAAIAVGIVGCGGGGGGGGGGHVDTVTASFITGDTNYSNSSGAVSISVQ